MPSISIFDTHLSGHLSAIDSLGQARDSIVRAGELLRSQLFLGRKVFLCGNGGSAADAQHIAAELVGRYSVERRGLPAIALTTDTSVLTAVGNDFGYTHIFARQVEALADPGDVLIAISTSGRSANVLAAVRVARTLKCHTIGLLGCDGGPLATVVDIPVIVGGQLTAHVQECHIVVGHLWCAMVDSAIQDSRP